MPMPGLNLRQVEVESLREVPGHQEILKALLIRQYVAKIEIHSSKLYV